MWMCSGCELKFANIQDAMKHSTAMKSLVRQKKDVHFVKRDPGP